MRLAPALVLGLVAFAAALPAQIEPGEMFPSSALRSLSQAPLPPTEGKVALVDFWASWCAPCRASFPAFSRLAAAYGAQGLSIVAVSVDESESGYASFVARFKPPFATVRDREHELVRLVQVPTMPTSYLVDRSGRVRFVHAGFHGEPTERELRGEIEALLRERPQVP